jgi:16S rRNA G527 N7-methylase RsmG
MKKLEVWLAGDKATLLWGWKDGLVEIEGRRSSFLKQIREHLTSTNVKT